MAASSQTPATPAAPASDSDKITIISRSSDNDGINDIKDDNASALLVYSTGNLKVGPTSDAPEAPNTTISFDVVAPATVHIRNLVVTVNTAPAWGTPSTWGALAAQYFKPKPQLKTLLHDVSATFAPGSLTAIIGGSGSGKTTLLNTLAERMNSSRLAVDGSVLVNGLLGIHNVRHAYVMQQDVLLPSLTVRETLMYSAALRLPSTVSEVERERVVEEVILELGLKECADTRIGDSQHRGCSGGEKRRVSIGVQLLANPSLLFLDEPTTGLDATSAFQLVRTLKALAAKGRTILTTIHQPRSEIWDLFDNLIVLSGGSPVYAGTRTACLTWFEGLGHAVPAFVNPAEFMIDIAAVDNRSPELESESKERVSRLKEAWTGESTRLYPTIPPTSESEKAIISTQVEKRAVHAHASFMTQTRILTARTFKVTYRDPMGMMAALLETTLMGIVTGYIFYNLGRDASGIRSREGALYSGAALQGYLMLLFEVYRMTVDMPTFDRERGDGCVDPLPFIASRRLARFPTEDLPVPLVFSVILYFMAGFDRTAVKFFTFFGISLLNHYIAMTCAMMCVALCRDFPGASLAANLIYTVQSLGCGMFIQSDTLPVYLRWLKYITYTWYCIGAYAGNEFQGSFYDCPYSNDPSDPACTSYTGAGIMHDFGFPQDWLAKPVAVLVAFVAFFIATTFLLLRFVQVSMTIARSRSSDDVDMSAGKEKMAERSVDEVRAIDVSLKGFTLDLDKKTAYGWKLPRKTILRGIDATFQAGVLNVIMGPSGSGKTSLLNSMALRLHNNMTTAYLPSGTPLFNGAAPSPSVIRSLTSYVCQDDNGLLPSLTVRETLRFAAALRLPSWMSGAEKNRRADEVLMKLGLKDCADNLVGSDLIKGISGGEKRRVSIAVQILMDPRILLLDEPTSGLDAFTANSLMEVLSGLAAEGRTLILTIHQARSDLFDRFGNVLLLARGGSPVYAGPTNKMLDYLEARGLVCPAHSNPADFALDAITIDLQEEKREAESRVRVANLIDAWKKREVDSGESGVSVKPRTELEGRSLATPAELGALVRTPASLFAAMPILLHRGVLNVRRQPPLLVARITQVLSLAILMALFFAPVKHDYYSIQNRMGIVQQMAGFYFTGMLQNVALYPGERDVFYREHDDGVYGVTAFLAVYSMLEVPFELVASFISGLFVVFVIGLRHDVTLFFVTVFSVFAITSCGESVGILFNTFFASHTGFAVTLTSVVLSLANSMGGVLSTNMPALLDGANYLSPIRYATRAMAVYSLRGVKFTCGEGQKTPDGTCQVETGEQALELYRLDVDAVMSVVGLAVCMVVYRLVGWGVVKVARTRFGEDK